MTQNIRFVDTHIVELRYDIQELAGLDHANNLQELPTGLFWKWKQFLIYGA